MKNVYYKCEKYASFIRPYRIKDGYIEVDYIDDEPESFPYTEELENKLQNRMLKESRIWISNYNDFSQMQKLRTSIQFGTEAFFCAALIKSLKMTLTSETMRITATVFYIGCFLAYVHAISEFVYIRQEEREIKKHRTYYSIFDALEKIQNDEKLKEQFSQKLQSLNINTINKYSLRSINNIEKELVNSGLYEKGEKIRTRKNELN